MARHRRWPLALVVPGVALALGSFVWQGAAADALVKLPTDLDTTAAYRGTITLYVDPVTKVPLATPLVHDLDISRTVRAIPEESTGELVVIRESVTITSDGMPPSAQEHQYVMDRTTSNNVSDPRAWAYTEDNVVDRAGTHRLFFPFHTDPDESQPVWKDEMGIGYEATPTVTERSIDGVAVVTFAAGKSWTPVTDAYLANLAQTVPLPATMTLDQLKPLLAGRGLDIDQTLGALLPVLSPEDLKALVDAAGKPIELEYVQEFEGVTAVEPVTGSPVDVSRVVETLGALPAPSTVAPLADVLRRYPTVPEAIALADALEAVGAAPIPLFTNEYAQTAASVTDSVAKASDGKAQILLVEDTIPLWMLVAGIVLALVGVVLMLVPKRSPKVETPMHAPDLEHIPAKDTTAV